MPNCNILLGQSITLYIELNFDTIFVLTGGDSTCCFANKPFMLNVERFSINRKKTKKLFPCPSLAFTRTFLQ